MNQQIDRKPPNTTVLYNLSNCSYEEITQEHCGFNPRK